MLLYNLLHLLCLSPPVCEAHWTSLKLFSSCWSKRTLQFLSFFLNSRASSADGDSGGLICPF